MSHKNKLGTLVPPHPDNAPGLFYVENHGCMACGAPESEAPDLMAHDDQGHCYFRRQPLNAKEHEAAVVACIVSCCGAVRYAGRNATVLQRVPDACDALEDERLAQKGLSPSQLRGRLEAELRLKAAMIDPLWDREMDS